MKRAIILLLIFLLILLLIPSAVALGTLPAVNEQPRHLVCDSLSDMAQEYYTDDCTYEKLSALSGAGDCSTGYTAMQDNALFDALHELMSDTHRYYSTYSGSKAGSLAYFWMSTDAAASSDSYVMFYSDFSGDEEELVMNREHIWPKSRASFSTSNGGADLHHLRPSVSTLNNAKSNHAFGNIVGVYPGGYTAGSVLGEVCYWVKTDADLFECRDDVKGDVARILLYVYCRWEQPNLYTDVDVSLLPENEKNSTNSGQKVIESLDTLLSWCAEDPVDTWEMRRNDLVESVQGNRNVFIDYPELAWQLFGKTPPSGMRTPSSGGAQSDGYVLGDADGDGVVTIVDATVIQYRLANIPAPAFDPDAADADRDGEISAVDATLLKRYLAGVPSPAAVGAFILRDR